MRLLLRSSIDFHEGVTETFHFVNTLRVAMEQLSVDVRKIVSAGADDRVLAALYSPPSGATGQNIRQFASKTNEEQSAELARVWLFTAIAHYEVWAEQLPVPHGARGAQFPSKSYTPRFNSSGYLGYSDSFSDLVSDSELSGAYAATFAASGMHLSSRVEDALVLYRFYKEIRNSLTHQGGVPKQRLVDISQDAIANSSDLHAHVSGDAITLPLVQLGSPLVLTLEQVRCFVNLLLRLVYTLDSQIMVTQFGRQEIISRLQSRIGTKRLNIRERKMERWIPSEFSAVSLPWPENPLDILPFLQLADVVHVRP
jgi:hypothetical protein